MTKTYDVAVVGATGLVGGTMLSILAERKFPLGKLYALASKRSEGSEVEFGRKTLDVEDLATFDFSKVQIALFSPGASVSAIYAPLAAAAGCVVIDNTSQFRYDDDIPLVIPEVNPEALASYKNRNIVANPNCSTIQMLVALKPLHDVARILRVNVATYQAVSGAGNKAVKELATQTTSLLSGRPVDCKVFPKQIAFNALPQIDVFLDNGYTKEEMKMVWETRKILGEPNMQVNPTAVRIPVFFGHSAALHIETERKLSAAEAHEILSQAPGIMVMDGHSDGEYPTAVVDAANNDPVFVGRIREDISHPNGLDLWVVADNVRKGAALNSVQIAELLVSKYI